MSRNPQPSADSGLFFVLCWAGMIVLTIIALVTGYGCPTC